MINKNIALNLRSGNSKELAQKIENLKEKGKNVKNVAKYIVITPPFPLI